MMGFIKKKVIICFILFSFFLNLFPSVQNTVYGVPTTYYVDADNGSDSNSGTSEAAAWKTIPKVNASTFAPGDQILFKRGCVWREQTISLSSSGTSANRIRISAYGTGDKPIISGGRQVTGFTEYYGSIYVADMPLDAEPYLATRNGKLLKRSTTSIVNGMLFDAFRWENNKLYINDREGNPDETGKQMDVAVTAHAVRSNSKNYITIDGLKLTTTGGALISLDGNTPTSWIIENCEIMNAQSGFNTAGAVHFSGAKACIIRNNVIKNSMGDGIMLWNSYDCEVTGNTITDIYKGINAGGDGIQSSGKYPTSASRNKITKNYINVKGQDTGKGCIIQENGTDCVISENICFYGNFGVESSSTNGVVERNFCAFQGLESGYTWAAGLYSAADFDISNQTWRYNVVANCPSNGIYFPTSTYKVIGAKVYNNTIYQCGRGFSSNNPISGEFKNNIIWNTTGSSVLNIPSVISGESFISDYNLYDPISDSKKINYKGVGYSTLEAFQNTWGYDTHSITQDPQFNGADQNNFRLRSTSPALDSGLTLGLNADFEKAIVPQGNGVNMGALESIDDTIAPTPTPTIAPSPKPTASPTPVPTVTASPVPHTAGTIFYVDADNGDDANIGTSETTAWKTIQKVNDSLFLAGDQILFKSGCTWREETIQLRSSGNASKHIRIGSYGAGEKPVISGGRPVSGFTPYYGSIYQADLPLETEPYLVVSNNKVLKRSTTSIENGLLFGSFRWENNILYVNDVEGNPDATGKKIEAAVSAFSVVSNSRNYITIDGLKLTTTGGAAITLGGDTPSYWTIENCEISNTQSGYNTSGAIHLSGAKYIIIRNNTISNSMGDGVMLWNSTDCEVRGNNISKIYRGIDPGGDGIQSGGKYAWSGSRNKIIGNYINVQGQDTGKGCIIQENGSDCIISDNICLYGNFGVEANSDNEIIEGNYLAYQGLESGYTWAAGLYSSGEDHSNMTFRNNIVVDCPYNGIYFPDASYKRSNTKIYNNTIVRCGKGFSSNSPVSGEFKNNIIWGTTGANVYKISTVISGESMVTDYNLLDPISASKSIVYNGVTYNSLESYQQLGYDTHSLMTDPEFVNSEQDDFHLKETSPVIDTGTDVGIIADYDKVSVPQGNGVDLGALEYAIVTPEPSPTPSPTPVPTPVSVSALKANNIYELSGLQVYEGFNYPYTLSNDVPPKPDNYINGDGGTVNGWAGAWSAIKTLGTPQPTATPYPDYNASEKPVVLEGSLSYSGVTAIGNHVRYRGNLMRSFSESVSGTKKPVWISMINGFVCNNDANYAQLIFKMDNTAVFQMLQRGYKTPTATPKPGEATPVPNLSPYYIAEGGNRSLTGAVSSGKGFVGNSSLMANFVLIRLEGKTAKLWVNPDVSTFNESVPPNASITSSQNIEVNKLHFVTSGYDSWLDEFRVGYDIQSVISENNVNLSYTPVFSTPAFSNGTGNIDQINEMGEVTASVHVNYKPELPLRTAALVVALYQADGTLVTAKVNQVEDIRSILTNNMGELSLTVNVTDPSQYIKAFLWEGLNDLVPITMNQIGT